MARGSISSEWRALSRRWGRWAAVRLVLAGVLIATVAAAPAAVDASRGSRGALRAGDAAFGAAFGAAGFGDGATDITATALGRMLATQAVRRYAAGAAGGIGSRAMRPTDLVVLRDRTGITIGPRSAEYAAVPPSGRPLAGAIEVVPRTPSFSSLGSSIASATSALPGWLSLAAQCFTRISDGFTWLDHCYVLYRLVGESDGSHDWFAVSHFATMQANMPWVMNAAQIGTAPFGPTPQEWVDWQPRSDLRGGCNPIVVAIGAPVPGISDTAIRCESWTIAKSAVAGQFSVTWDGHGQRAARELSMAIAVRVPQGTWPQWFLPASVSGSPF